MRTGQVLFDNKRQRSSHLSNTLRYDFGAQAWREFFIYNKAFKKFQCLIETNISPFIRIDSQGHQKQTTEVCLPLSDNIPSTLNHPADGESAG